MNPVKVYDKDGNLKEVITPEELSRRDEKSLIKKKADTITGPVKRADYKPVKDGTQ